MRAVLTAAMLVAAAACYSPSYTDATLCGPQGECPPGRACNAEGHCVLGGVSTPDAALADAAPSRPDASPTRADAAVLAPPDAPPGCIADPPSTTCANRCGSVTNNCGQPVTCTSANGGVDCVAPQTCGGGDAPDMCGCTPLTCADFPTQCGTSVADGCGGTLDCSKRCHTVTYKGNGSDSGTPPVDSKSYVEAALVTTLGNTGNLAKSGYAFAGWTTNPNAAGTSESHAAGGQWSMGSKDVVLFAVWMPSIFIYASSGDTISIENHMACPSGDLVIPPGVTSIGNAINGCDGVTSVSIPSSVMEILSYGLSGATDLTTITVDSTNPSYSSVAGALFDKAAVTLLSVPCGLTSYDIPSSVTSVGADAFVGCRNLLTVSFPPGVTSIGEFAFFDCQALTDVTLPSGLTSIGTGAFEATNLTNVTIPASVATIDEGPFSSCARLTSIAVDPANPNFSSSSGALFDKDKKTLIQVPGSLTSYAVPSTVTRIAGFAFSGCSALTSLTIPTGVTSIGDHAFVSCIGLTTVTLPSTLESLGYYAFDGSGLTHITIPASVTSIDTLPFYNCQGLTSIAVDPANPNYSSLSGVLFDKSQSLLIEVPSAITSVTIPTTVTTIGYGAFETLYGLSAVTVPTSVTTISNEAFACSMLTGVTMQAASPPSLGDAAFDLCGMPSYNIHVPNAAAVTAYRAAPLWSNYASRIVTP